MSVSTAPLPAVSGAAAVLDLKDDAPFAAVSLSFNFPFYQPTRYLWIDPNGALHMHSPTPPCCVYTPSPSALNALPTLLGCSFEQPAGVPDTTVCTIDTSIAYTDLIAPSLLDLDPSQTPGSVLYVDSGSQLLVQWVDVPWWVLSSDYNTTYYSFDVLLSVDGTVQFHYTSVADPTGSPEVVNATLPPIPRTWLVGLRQEAWRDTETANAADYSTNRTGLYPPAAWVADGNTIRFCPLDTSFCVWPTDGALTGNTLVLLASANMTCASVWNHTYSLSFSLPSGAVASAEAAYDPTTNTLQVLTPAVAEAGVASVQLVDETTNTTVQFATPLFFTFHAASMFNRTTIAGYCTACVASNPYYCITDCAGEYMGAAVLDACGQCSNGTTNATYNAQVNCAGSCGLSTDNYTITQCLCEQLQYPPVVQGWVPGTESVGQYVGPVGYYVQRGLFDVGVCGLSWSVDDVWDTLRPLQSYQTFVLAATSLLLALTLSQAVSVQLKRPLVPDPFHPSLYMAEQPPAAVVVQQPNDEQQQQQAEEASDAAASAAAEAVALAAQARVEGAGPGARIEEEQKEDAALSLGASDLWRRRQSQQVASGLEQHPHTQAAADKDEKTSEAMAVATGVNEAAHATHEEGVRTAATRVATAAPARAAPFVPPVASPFAVPPP